MVGWDRSDPWEKCIACASPFAAKAAPTEISPPSRATQYLWERL
jgi:hypothetical protein